LNSELLSAYLDAELGLAETERIESHCLECAACRSCLNALKRISREVGSLGSGAPPAALRAQIRSRVAAQPPALGRTLLAKLRWLFEVPSQPALRHRTAFLFVLVASGFLFTQVGDRAQRGALVPREGGPQRETVETYAGDPPLGNSSGGGGGE